MSYIFENSEEKGKKAILGFLKEQEMSRIKIRMKAYGAEYMIKKHEKEMLPLINFDRKLRIPIEITSISEDGTLTAKLLELIIERPDDACSPTWYSVTPTELKIPIELIDDFELIKQ